MIYNKLDIYNSIGQLKMKRYTSNNMMFNQKGKLIGLFSSTGRWVKIRTDENPIIIGISDLHGDCRTLNHILDEYFFKIPNSILIACGDFLDRNPKSWDNEPTAALDTLLNLKLQYPDRVFLLMGNHDLSPHTHIPFAPSNAWDMMSGQTLAFYTEVLESLPIVATVNDIAFAHGVLPTTTQVDDLPFDEIYNCVWSDYVEHESLGSDSIRKKVGINFFQESLDKFSCNLLIKGHNPFAPLISMNQKCITIQTTRQFHDICGSHMVVVDSTKQLNDVQNAKIVTLETKN